MLKIFSKFLIKNKTTILIVLLYLLLPLIAFWRNFDFSKLNLTFFDAEFLGGFYPDLILGSNLVKHFHEMLWDPYNLLGLPLLGTFSRLSLFYPVKFLFYFVSSLLREDFRLFVFTYFPLFHLSLAGIFMYAFVRKVFKFSLLVSFVVGLIYAFNGTFVHFIAYSQHGVGPAYLPLVLLFLYLAVEKMDWAKALLAGIFIAPVLLSGYTPSFVYSNLFALLFLLLAFYKDKKKLFWSVVFLGLANVMAMALSAATLIPAAEGAVLSDRLKFNLYGAGSHPFYVESVLYYLFPHFFGLVQGNTNIVYGYVGIVPLILVYFALRKRSENEWIGKFLLLGGIFFVLSLGNETFIHDVAYNFVPHYAYFRLTAFLQYLVAFCLAVLSGFGLSFLLSDKGREIYLKLRTPLIVFGSFLVLFFFEAFLFKASDYTNQKLDAVELSIFLTLVFFLAGLILLRQLVTNSHSQALKILLTLIIILDLFTLVGRATNSNSEIDPRVLNGPSEISDWLVKNTKDDSSRVFLHEMNARYNSANRRIYQIGGYMDVYPRTVGLIFNPFADSDPGWFNPESKILDLMGVKYIATSKKLDLKDYPNTKLVFATKIKQEDFYKFMTMNGTMLAVGTDFYIYENMDKFPHAFMVGNVVLAGSDDEAAKIFTGLDFSKEAVITVKNHLPIYEDLRGNPENYKDFKSQIVSYQSSKVKIRTDSDKSGILVLTDTYYPGWEVFVDGVKKEILKADVGLRGVYLTGGKHDVLFEYVPGKLYWGMMISGFCGAGLILIFGIKLFYAYRKDH